MVTPEIEELKMHVERRYGKVLATSTDFDRYSSHIKNKYHIDISPSTLKRLWGYVNDHHKPRVQTLNQLSQYIGYANYSDFISWLKTSTKYNSSFFNAVQVTSSDVKLGASIEIGWSPNRLVRLQSLGNSVFEVIQSINSKLCVGDRFMTGCFIKNQPLYLSYIDREGERTAPFVAGRNGGLTIINVLEGAK